MAIVAGLFDSQADATEAMDRLLREHIPNLDTRVIDRGSSASSGDVNSVIPIIPNTSGGFSQSGIGAVPFGTGSDKVDWLDNLDEVEQAFYYEGLKEGASLALAEVDDQDAEKVRQLMRRFGARTYSKD